MNKITGEELAFPVAGPTDKGFAYQPGMTLRQYFAGQALAGLAQNVNISSAFRFQITQELVKSAVSMADLLIAELNEKK